MHARTNDPAITLGRRVARLRPVAKSGAA